MSRRLQWGIAWFLAALACLPILARRSESAGLLADTDTRVLLAKLAERSDPWSWFAGDWPLENHFYRPISTLMFELDRFLSGSNPAGYGWTNAVLASLAVLGVFWLVRELADEPWLACGSAVVFALWTVDEADRLAPAAWAAAAISALAMLVPGRDRRAALGAALLWSYLALEIGGLSPLAGRILHWLPGRTASTMAVFALVCLAAYTRYERLSAHRAPAPDPSPLDPPATKSAEAAPALPKAAAGWAILSLVALAAALGSYEQAVGLPFLLAGCAWVLGRQRYQVRIRWIAAAFGVLGLYALVRWSVIPPGSSAYQEQQIRFTRGAADSLIGFALPAYPAVRNLLVAWTDPLLLLTAGPWQTLLQAVSTVAAVIRARSAAIAVFAWLGSIAAFAPMAFLKPFEHYSYFPMALRAILAASLIGLGGRALVSAASRPAIQAPPRPRPAPGSLPRP